MKKVLLSLSLMVAFIFAFTFAGVGVHAEDVPTTPSTTETEENPVATTENTATDENTATTTTEETSSDEFTISDEQWEQIKNAITEVANGDLNQAYNDLKAILGVGIATVVLSVLVCVGFAVKYFRKSAFLKAVQSKLDADTNAKIDAALDKVDEKLTDVTNKVNKKIADNNQNRKDEAQAQIDDLTNALTKAKTDLNSTEAE